MIVQIYKSQHKAQFFYDCNAHKHIAQPSRKGQSDIQ